MSISDQEEPGMANEPAAPTNASSPAPRIGVFLKSVVCLSVGIASGYMLRGSQFPAPAAPAARATQPSAQVIPVSGQGLPGLGQTRQPANTSKATVGGGRMPSPAEMEQMADTQAAPLLEKLKSDPNNVNLLSQVGAIYHTTSQFKQAAAYYNRAVRASPSDVALRIKLASSLYRGGDVDEALAQLNQVLSDDPKNANALFDLGVIKLHGKGDSKGALAAWERLLRSNPQLSADRKATVQKLIATVLTMQADQNGVQGAQSNDNRKSSLN